MRVLTVRQPWAWAIVHGGKDVENRTQAWSYRGPLAIHAGARLSERGCMIVPELLAETRGCQVAEYLGEELVYGAVIGVVDLVDVHTAIVYGTRDSVAELDCCESPWAETGYTEHGGRQRRDIVHLELANPRPLATPIPAKGRLGLWTPDADILAHIREQVSS